MGYPAKKAFDGIFIRFDTMHECDRQTGKQTPVRTHSVAW